MPKKPAPTIPDLSPAEMKLLERLIDAEILIAVPPKGMGKTRPVISASMIGGGKNLLLYLSREPVVLD